MFLSQLPNITTTISNVDTTFLKRCFFAGHQSTDNNDNPNVDTAFLKRFIAGHQPTDNNFMNPNHYLVHALQ